MGCSLQQDGDRALRASILVVDDVPTNLALLNSALGKEYRIQIATSGEEAITLASVESFELVLLDIMMPGLDGFQTLSRLREIPGFRKTPIIFLTASQDKEIEQAGLKLGAADFITKPFILEHIRLRIANLLERSELQKHLELALDSAELGLWESSGCNNSVRIDQRSNRLIDPALLPDPGKQITWEELCHPDDLPGLEQEILKLHEQSIQAIDIDIRIRADGGDWGWVHLFGKVIVRGKCGQATRMMGTFRDIQRRKRIEEAKQRSEEQLRLVMEATGEGVWDWTVQNQAVSHNASWCRILGLDENYLVHSLDFFKALIHPDDLQSVEQALISCLESNAPYQSEHRLLNSNGEYIWVLDRGKVVARAADGTPIRMLGSIKDISLKKRQESEIHHLAFYDFLTGLPNRRLLVERMSQGISLNDRKRTHSAIMFIDMDRFKELNDKFGHEAGDQLLIEVGKRLLRAVRACDTVARLGGDEFVVMLGELSSEQEIACIDARQVGEKILASLNDAYLIEQQLFCSTPSIGLTVYAGAPATVESVLKLADDAMYQAKAGGRNCLRMALPQ